MRKRLLSILLLCCMVLTLLPTTALAEEAAPAFNLATDLAGITIPNDLVTCVCTKANESKKYGQLPGGFSASQPGAQLRRQGAAVGVQAGDEPLRRAHQLHQIAPQRRLAAGEGHLGNVGFPQGVQNSHPLLGG